MGKPRWVLTSSITADFALAVLLLLVMGGGTYAAQADVAVMNASVGSTLVLLDQSELVFALLIDAEASQRGYSLIGANRFLKPYEEAMAALPGESATLQKLCAGRPEAQRHLARLEVLIKTRIDELRGLIELRRHQGADAASLMAAMDAGTSTMEEIRAVIAGLRSVARSDLELRRTLRDKQLMRNRARAAGTIFSGAFLAVLSHEMRAPLHAIFGWLSILKIGLAQGRDVSRAIETVERNAGLQAQLVNDLLDVSRIVSGKLVLTEQPVELTAVVRTVVENAGPAAATKGIALACEMATLPICVVVGDEARLFQVLSNLLNNAIKFTPSGGNIRVTLASDAGEATIQVRDTGSGIAPAFLAHIFERFRQADATNTRAHGGLGIGLYLVKTLMELHKGTVAVSSEGPGKGATFTVRLPLQFVAQPPQSTRVALDEGNSTQLAGTTVVLVDDELDCREAIGLLLRARGADVHICGSADEARTVIERVRPDVIVSDIGMPGEDGYAFIRSVRARGEVQIPAVALTGFASQQDVEEATRAGFDAHLGKPVRTDVLVAKLRELVDRVDSSPSPVA